MRSILAIVALIGSLLSTAAQVTVELVLDQEQFLRNESLPVRLRIRNFAGETLHLGGQNDWLIFNIDNREGQALTRIGEIPITKPFSIEPTKTATLKIDLMPYFNLGEIGRYTVTATVRVPQIKKDFKTEGRPFDIISGMRLWEREFGMPGRGGADVRKYALQQAEFGRQMRLYARVMDSTETKLFKVAPLGPIVSFSANTLEALIDKSSNLHVLFQTGRNTFIYGVVEPDGEQIIRQTHEQTTTRPHLRVEDDGRIVVAGGQRRLFLSDLPPSHVASTNDATTNAISH